MEHLPPSRVDLTALFPRVIGKLEAHAYMPWHVGLERLSTKHYQRIIAGFCVKYLDDHQDKVWFIFIWPFKRGRLYDKGRPNTGQGVQRMEWLVPRCPYRTFVKQQGLLVKIAEVIGRARPYP